MDHIGIKFAGRYQLLYFSYGDLPGHRHQGMQQQRARMMMMMELAKSTAHVDVYIVGSNNTGVGGPGPTGRGLRSGPERGG